MPDNTDLLCTDASNPVGPDSTGDTLIRSDYLFLCLTTDRPHLPCVRFRLLSFFILGPWWAILRYCLWGVQLHYANSNPNADIWSGGGLYSSVKYYGAERTVQDDQRF